MRWDELRVDEDGRRALPGYRDPAVVRTFDAPEALDTRFYEVRARSALNRVPARSQMPFRWTINPYRGCTHACSYCASGDTPILLGDGRTKPLADLAIGERIYGTVGRGSKRRYALTDVLDHWSSIKPAYRVTLEDGTELTASGDHRFLTRRGWRHVTGAEQGPGRRPHLSPGDALLGTGGLGRPPDACRDYRHGYLCGLIGGAGPGTYPSERPGASRADVHGRLLALGELEALRRARAYLRDRDLETRENALAAAAGPVGAIRAQAPDPVPAIRWPRSPSTGWCKGFLAGTFDAGGSYSGPLQVATADAEVIDRIASSMRRLGFAPAIEDRPLPGGVKRVRLLGGLREQLRFLQTTDPAITRKRSIEGRALESAPCLGVETIEPLGTRRLYDITTGTADFLANGVVSHNCFARPTHTYLDMNAGRDFEREIVVKVNAPEVLRAELRRPSWRREHVAMGTNTDPYQWVESRYRLMPGIWEALRDGGTPASVLTKSPLLLRDLDLMKEVPEIRANLSVPTLDERAWRATEPHTPHPRARLEAVAELNRAGVPCGILIAPLMPGINDAPEQVARIIELAEEAGAVDIGGIALHLRGEVKELFFEWLRERRPDLLARYERLYARGAYAPKDERQRLGRLARPKGRPARPLRGAGAVADRDPAVEAPAGGGRTAARQQRLF